MRSPCPTSRVCTAESASSAGTGARSPPALSVAQAEDRVAGGDRRLGEHGEPVERGT